MPQGLQCWDASGSLTLDVTDAITRILGVVTDVVGAGGTGTITHPEWTAGGRPFWFFTQNASGTYIAHVGFDWDDTTKTLTYYKVAQAGTIIYGVY